MRQPSTKERESTRLPCRAQKLWRWVLLIPAVVLVYLFVALILGQGLLWLFATHDRVSPMALNLVVPLCATGAATMVSFWVAPTLRLWPVITVWASLVSVNAGLSWLVYRAQEALSPLDWSFLGVLLGGGLAVTWVLWRLNSHGPDQK